MERCFLIVTANKNETEALMADKEFYHFELDKRSMDPNDDNFYNVGKVNEYKIVHLELLRQGSVREGASITAIIAAVSSWNPDGVILTGIAFGKNEHTQNIGDVLISSGIADYESGKILDKKLLSDGSIPDSGKTLLSVFNHFSESWTHEINGRKAKCHIGVILSGDKVVDDSDFKKELFSAYPRAIGGEMEGRGAYAACRSQRVSEWIIVKAICDWGENKDNPHKEEYQKIAAASAASLLKHIFSQEAPFSKLPKAKNECPTGILNKNATLESNAELDKPIGFFITVGITSCRLFEVCSKDTLQELKTISYEISDPSKPGYLEGIIHDIKTHILGEIPIVESKLLIKVFVDYNFAEVFNPKDISEKEDFIANFYKETNLSFNILTKTQTTENLMRMFGANLDDTAIIDINQNHTDILLLANGEAQLYSIPVTLQYIKEYVENQKCPEKWSTGIVQMVRDKIKERIGNSLSGVKVGKAIIIKDELKFMKALQYPLRQQEGQLSLSFGDYKKRNQQVLFCADREYFRKLSISDNDEATARRLYDFKYGHIIIETVLELIGNERVIPKDEHSIYGSGVNTLISYIFNVVLSGSTHEGREKNMIEARNFFISMGATVTSPHIDDYGRLNEITSDTEHAHLKAIRECDVLFICNKGSEGYIGEKTKCHIYYAYALHKTIAFWREPPEDEQMSFIPREHWDTIMQINK